MKGDAEDPPFAGDTWLSPAMYLCLQGKNVGAKALFFLFWHRVAAMLVLGCWSILVPVHACWSQLVCALCLVSMTKSVVVVHFTWEPVSGVEMPNFHGHAFADRVWGG